MTSQKIELKSKSLKSTVCCWTAILSWRKEHLNHIVTHKFCMHIETVNLFDGDYKLVPENIITLERECFSLLHWLESRPGPSPRRAQCWQCSRRQAQVHLNPIIFAYSFMYICVVMIYFFAHLSIQALFVTVNACS